MLESFFNTIFSPILGFNPLVSLSIICLIISSLFSFLNKKMMEKSKADEVKKKMDKMRSELLEAQKSGDQEKTQEQMKKMMEMNAEYLQSMIKPLTVSLVVSMLLFILFFPWLRETYTGNLMLPLFLPVVGGEQIVWWLWYMICSVFISLILRKILGI